MLYYGVVLQVSIAEEDRCFSIIPNIYLLLWQAGTLLSGWGRLLGPPLRCVNNSVLCLAVDSFWLLVRFLLFLYCFFFIFIVYDLE